MASREFNHFLTSFPVAEYCEGIVFLYFVPDKRGHFRQVDYDPVCRQVENKILKRLQYVFKNRPDLLGKMGCIPDGLEVRIYKANGWTEDEKGRVKKITEKSMQEMLHFVGRTSHEGHQVIMEFAAYETLYGLEKAYEGFEVVVHEFVHLLDFFGDNQGYLPGWTTSQRAAFRKARKAELLKIKDNESILSDYAAVDHGEFLAVLAEAYFETPQALKKSNLVLFELVQDFFRIY